MTRDTKTGWTNHLPASPSRLDILMDVAISERLPEMVRWSQLRFGRNLQSQKLVEKIPLKIFKT